MPKFDEATVEVPVVITALVSEAPLVEFYVGWVEGALANPERVIRCRWDEIEEDRETNDAEV